MNKDCSGIKLLSISMFLVSTFAEISQADAGKSVKASPKRRIASVPRIYDEAPTLRFYLGMGVGLNLSQAPDLGFNGWLTGLMVQGQATASYQRRKFVLDGSLGWLYSRLSGDQQPTSNAITVTNVLLITQTGFFEISPRYKFNENYELGPTATFLFGAQDPYGYAGVAKESVPLFAGIKGVRNFDVLDFPARVFVQLSTDLTLIDRQVYAASVGIEFAPFEVETTSEPKTKIVEKVVYKEVVKEIVNFAFDDQSVHFATASAQLTPKSKKLIQELGKFLAENQIMWQTVRIEGHTDQRGSIAYNLDLSSRRARTVQSLLEGSGVALSRMTAAGLGKSKPLSASAATDAWSENRRVELSFAGVTQPEKFREGVNRIRTRVGNMNF